MTRLHIDLAALSIVWAQKHRNWEAYEMRWIGFHHWKRKTKDVTFAKILPAHPLQGLRARIQQAKADNAEFHARKAIYDRTFNQLSAMSNRDLADIGIRSSDIESIAAQAVEMH
jgi:uncharacterized protein YjiS (DUF1127 family)